MQSVLTHITLFLVCTSVAFSQGIEDRPDPVLVSLQQQLESALGELEPCPTIEIPEGYSGKSMILRYKTRQYMVYPNAKGRIGSELQEKEGPSDDGILLRLHVQKEGEVNQAVVPQTIREPYWSTYLNVYPVEGSNKQLYLALSYRGWTDKKFIEKIKQIVEQADAGNG